MRFLVRFSVRDKPLIGARPGTDASLDVDIGVEGCKKNDLGFRPLLSHALDHFDPVTHWHADIDHGHVRPDRENLLRCCLYVFGFSYDRHIGLGIDDPDQTVTDNVLIVLYRDTNVG